MAFPFVFGFGVFNFNWRSFHSFIIDYYFVVDGAAALQDYFALLDGYSFVESYDDADYGIPVPDYVDENVSTKVAEQSLELKELINEMQRVFATKVSAIGNDNKGRIYIDYYSRDDLDRLSDLIELLKKKEITLGDLRNYNKRHPEK